ncbi:hypothetical protein VXS03_00340 [Photobacterium sp. S4TG1]|uniref:hypothetical protein n=1 Tax=Photobacterium sp. S4TG1 TaxID=3114587 RepID=UPI002E19D612|nr:hypothetical protein [Photobacterium sp. S4TG1]
MVVIVSVCGGLDRKIWLSNINVSASQPKLLQQMGVNGDAWLDNSHVFMEHYTNVSGKWSRMCLFQQHFGGRWCKGKVASQRLHPN